MFKPGKAVVPANASGTAPDAAVTPGGIEISFDRGANRGRQATIGLIASNLEAAGGNVLEISFNEGKDWFGIPPAQAIPIPVLIHRIRVRGASGATTLYSLLGIVG
jgi:hypothetical protein